MPFLFLGKHTPNGFTTVQRASAFMSLVAMRWLDWVLFFRGVMKQYRACVSRLTLAFLLLSNGMFISASAFLPSSFSMYMTLISMGAWFSGHLPVGIREENLPSLNRALSVVGGCFCSWPHFFSLTQIAIIATAVSTFLGWPFAAIIGWVIPSNYSPSSSGPHAPPWHWPCMPHFKAAYRHRYTTTKATSEDVCCLVPRCAARSTPTDGHLWLKDVWEDGDCSAEYRPLQRTHWPRTKYIRLGVILSL